MLETIGMIVVGFALFIAYVGGVFLFSGNGECYECGVRILRKPFTRKSMCSNCKE